jgi:tetratricopeptide (TPR) repeat protein
MDFAFFYEIKNLLYFGKVDEAKTEINNLSDKFEFLKQYLLMMLYRRTFEGKKAETICNDQLTKISDLLSKSEIILDQNNFDGKFDYNDEKVRYNFIKMIFLIRKARFLIEQNKDEALTVSNEVRDIFQKFGILKENENEFVIIPSSDIKSNFAYHFMEALYAFYLNRAIIFYHLLNHHEYFRFTNLAIKVAEKIRHMEGIASANHNLGVFHSKLGNLDLAIHHLNIDVEYCLKINNKIGMLSILNYLSEIYVQQGRFEKALETCYNALKKVEMLGLDSFRSITPLLNLSDIYRVKLEYDKSISYAKEAHLIAKQKDTENWEKIEPNVIVHLIEILIDKGDLTSAKSHLEEFEKKFSDDLKNNHRLKLKCNYIYAKLLQNSLRLSEIGDAIKIYKTIIDSDRIDSKLQLNSMVNYTELLIRELKFTNNENIISEIIEKLNQLSTLAENNQIFPLIVDVSILKAFLSLVTNKISEAETFFEEALEFSEKYSLLSHIEKVKEIKSKFEDESHQWKRLLNSNPSLVEKVEKTKIEEYIKNARLSMRIS